MIDRITQRINRGALLFLLVLSCTVTSAPAAEGKKLVGGLSPEAALRAGERLYRTGMLPSGKPVAAIIRGNKRITGGDLTPCANCHTRSGLGAVVEEMLVPPINGPMLYAPLKYMQQIPGPIEHRTMFANTRPAYTDLTLANALVKGVSPSGRPLSPFMPRYQLTAKEAEVMVHYLKNLSAKHSPGVTEQELRFAVVLSDTVTPEARDALLQPLEAYFREEWNGRVVAQLTKRSTRWREDKPAGPLFRKVALDIWELKGGPEGWRSQLEAYNSAQPVFALLGGLVPGSWEPVHRFCEDNRIPCILPQTDLPVLSSSDWYTLYFSQGYYQEGAAAARYLAKSPGTPSGTPVIQVLRDNAEGKALAQGFAAERKKTGEGPVVQRIIAPNEKTDQAFWKKLAEDHPGAVMLVWLGAADLEGVASLLEPGVKKTPSRLFVSATLLDRSWQSIPDSLRDITHITYPNRLPDDSRYPREIFTGWMKMKKLPVLNEEISSKVYLLNRILALTLVDLGTEYYRDFFMDLLDFGKDQTSTSVVYPLLRFAPGQRYASVGCYVVTLTKGTSPRLVPQGEWILF